ncbi:hypothetical protein TSUD_268360 [Trifolium subterraneum]|uniref:Photolyase/cryptochrome alpha/beta domain-containing protein n=1 Tax=Trifolium subterraneum TaxID=3900 RepID=A0A2Z6PIH4_TRISU|nr:hypothetical protein TSUD_268360 [Trifolium subterraneum]
MTLLTFPHFPSNFPSLSRFPNNRFSPTRRYCLTTTTAPSSNTAILWFKHDLRTDDHPGLLAASKFQSIVPVYVFDHRILSRFSDEMLELILFALQDLRKSLRDRGSDLMIRMEQVQATCIFAEQEVEYELLFIMDVVNQRLNSMKVSQGTPKIELWKTPFYDIKETSADTLLGREMLKSSESGERSYSFRQMRSSESNESVFVTQKGNVVGGGTYNVLNALAAYLRYLEGTAREDWQEVHAKLRASESRNGASFNALFGPALTLGIISRRRVHYEVIKYEKERNGGFIPPFGYSTATIEAAAEAVLSKEWYWLLALRNQINNDEKQSTRIWRWNGFLIQYTVAGEDGPAVLLVHGFGAFAEHYRDNIHGLARAGNRVWAITLLGFGKSEKPNTVYTELLWAELLRDFIVDVVGEPVHLVGNSIGGYIVAIVSRVWSILIKSTVLINSAGNVIPRITSLSLYRPSDRQTSGATWLGSRILLFFLRLTIQDIVKKCYPTKVERADDWLINEMLRASYDPGVPVVLESIFSFNLSIPLNYLLEDVKEKVLIIQGMKDPISDSKATVAMLKEHCDGVIVKELDAGHCPHDEVPESVNTIICGWIQKVESNILAGFPV